MSVPRHHVAAVVLTAFLVAAPAAFAAVPAGTSPSGTEASGASFGVAVMGDSYSAGNGAGHYAKPSGCYRSPDNYAGRFVTAINKAPHFANATLTNVACSGAVTADVLGRGPQKRSSQVSQLPSNTNLVFLTIGGNDGHFASIVQNCLIELSDKGTKCDQVLAGAEALVKGGGSSTYATRLIDVLTKIHGKASAAKIVLLGYPDLIRTPNYTIPQYPHKSKPRVQVGKRLDAIQAAADKIEAAVIGKFDATHDGQFFFVSVQRLFHGHGLDPARTSAPSWLVAPLSTISVNTWFHPRPVGWAAEADLLLADATRYGVPTNTQPGAWPTKNDDGPPALYAYFGSEFESPSWVSCLADTSYCIAGLDDGYVHVIQMNGLNDVAQVPIKTSDAQAELTGIGFTDAQADYLLQAH